MMITVMMKMMMMMLMTIMTMMNQKQKKKKKRKKKKKNPCRRHHQHNKCTLMLKYVYFNKLILMSNCYVDLFREIVVAAGILN